MAHDSTSLRTRLIADGWLRFGADPVLAAWVRHVLPEARRAVADPSNRHWLRCGGTWFAGVNVLDNAADGAVRGGPPLAGTAVDFVSTTISPGPPLWDRAQISVCYPGYPQPGAGESASAFRYRRDRDAAHVDGLLPLGPGRRRHLREFHRFLLAVPLTASDADAAPFVVWRGSHRIIRDTLAGIYRRTDPDRWGEVDITDPYQAVRRRIFRECERVPVPARPGEAYLVHRLALHGVAPWAPAARAGPDGRMIAYFRPPAEDPRTWLDEP